MCGAYPLPAGRYLIKQITMLLTVFGASGQIGRLFVQQALDQGHAVRAYVRDPAKIKFTHPQLTVLAGDLGDQARIQQAIAGADAAVSLLGPPLKFWYSDQPIVDGHAHILRAMQATGVRRFVTIATPSTKSPKDQASVPTIVPGIMARLIFPNPYREIVAMGKLVQASSLDWTIVRFIDPTDKPATGQIRVSFGKEPLGMSIPRADIAAFVLQVLTRNEYVRDMPIIGS